MVGSSGEVRIGLTISGAVALGAYEGGALAALLSAVLAANDERPGALRIDAMAGASAGSITALLAARTLLRGMDPIETMYRSWVVTPQLDALRDGWSSPLSVEQTRKEAETLLDGAGDLKRAQPTPITVNMALGCLRGLDYSITRISGPPVSASTYLDWGEWSIEQSNDPAWYLEESGPLDTALASGAHAAAFPPKGLDRSDKEIQDRYRCNHIEHFPESKYLWYTDGGTIDNEPLGRTLDMTERIDSNESLGDAERLHLLITPDPARPPYADGPWATRDPAPSWAKTGLRTVALMRSQRLYDDLRRVEKTNSRIEWVRLLERKLLTILHDGGGDPEAALKEVTREINDQRKRLGEPDDLRRDGPSEPDSGLGDALRNALDAATGFAKKREVAVAVVSPLLIPEVANGSKAPRAFLAGEFLGHFGGFLEERLRQSDFALGYQCMLLWLKGETGLAHHGLDPQLSEMAIEGAEARWRSWIEQPGHEVAEGLGDETFGGLPFRTKLKLYKVGLRSAWIAFRQVSKLGK